jgi:hypothetical protein
MKKILAFLRELFSAPTDAAVLQPPAPRRVASKAPRPVGISGRNRSPETDSRLPGLVDTTMMSAEWASLMQDYVQEVVLNAPGHWETIVVYSEARRGQLIGGRCVFAQRALVDGEPAQDYAASEREFKAFNALFDHVSQTGSPWSAMRLTVITTGEYQTEYWYDSTPMLDGDYAEGDRRLGGASSPP